MTPLKERYSALPGQELGDEDTEFNSSIHTNPNLRNATVPKTSLLALICILIGIIVVESTFLVRKQVGLMKEDLLTLERNVQRQIYTSTQYISENETEATLAWDSILAGHGIIALDAEYAASRNLPKTHYLPGDPSQAVYIIEAYHAIHCIQIIRTHYLALQHGVAWDWSRQHDMHCFDALRQYVMCNPDTTLLYSTGHRDTGHGQIKMCKDWDLLRDWAQERSACYVDSEPHSGIQRWGDCTKDGDGLPVGSVL